MTNLIVLFRLLCRCDGAEGVPRRGGGNWQVLFKRPDRSGHVSRGALGDSRCGILNRTGVAFDQRFDQRRRLMEILLWLAACFVPQL